MTKIWLSPERRPNPHGKYWGFTNVYEHDLCCYIAEKVRRHLVRCGFDVKIASPEDPIAARVEKAKEWGADLYFPIHTNASSNGEKEGRAHGPLMLHYGSVGGLSYKACMTVYNRLMEVYPFGTKRGSVPSTNFYEIIKTPMLSVYAELAFHDNGRDARWLVDSRDAIAKALAQGVCDWYHIQYKDEPPTETGEYWKEKYENLRAELLKLCEKLEKEGT